MNMKRLSSQWLTLEILPGQCQVVFVVLHGLSVLSKVKIGISQLAVNGAQCPQVVSAGLDGSFKECHSSPNKEHCQGQSLCESREKNNTCNRQLCRVVRLLKPTPGMCCCPYQPWSCCLSLQC